MSFLYVLEQIEEGRINVKQALKKIEKDSQHRIKYRAKKVKFRIVDEGKMIPIPAIRFGMIKGILKICPSFVKFITKYSSSDIEESNEQVDFVIEVVSDVLDLMKEYPPIDLVNIKSEENEVVIYTK